MGGTCERVAAFPSSVEQFLPRDKISTHTGDTRLPPKRLISISTGAGLEASDIGAQACGKLPNSVKRLTSIFCRRSAAIFQHWYTIRISIFCRSSLQSSGIVGQECGKFSKSMVSSSLNGGFQVP